MKKLFYIALTTVATLAAISCQEDPLSEESVIKTSTVEKNEFDYWLEENYLKPYNIDFKYRYELYESNMGYYTVPADIDASIMYAHLVKYLCIDSYDEIAGTTFTRSYFPKMFFLIGTWEYNNTGTITLGTAEGGKKIMLSGVNDIPVYFKYYEGEELADALNTLYIKTIHHEFTHILNQTKDYPESFKDITADTYVNDAWNSTEGSHLQRGYISDYSQKEPREDFAELLSEYVTHDQNWWNQQLKAAGTTGASFLRTKMDIVSTYMADTWDIDLDELRDIVLRRTEDVIKGKVDLHNVALN